LDDSWHQVYGKVYGDHDRDRAGAAMIEAPLPGESTPLKSAGKVN
jgi:hypothetical protein